MGSTKHLTIKIYGRVQGVSFRQTAERKAMKWNVGGIARNEPDGSLYIDVEGSEENLKKFLKWCGKGPWFADVTIVDAVWSDRLKEYTQFAIK